MSARTRLVKAMLAIVMIATSAFAQSASRHRVEITKRPPRATLPAPRTIAGRAPGIVDWLGLQQAPRTLPTAGVRGTTILAGDVTLKGGTYALGGTPRLTIVAGTIRILGRVAFDVSGKGTGDAGGAVAILAAAVQCAPGATLTITSNGGKSSSPGVAGGNGGDFTLAADAVTQESAGPASPAPAAPRPAPRPARPTVPRWTAQQRGEPKTTRQNVACIVFSSTGGRGMGKTTTFTDRGGRRRPEFQPPRPGNPARLVRLASRAAAAQQDDLRLAISEWSLASVEHFRGAILDAETAGDDLALVRAFEGYATFTPPAQIHPRVREAYDAVRFELNKYRSEALPPAVARSIKVAPPGAVAQDLYVFTESSPFRQTLAPTHLLAAGVERDGRTVLGVLEYDPNKPEELSVEVELELVLDPWLAALAAAQLGAEGGKSEGMFSGWTLKAKPIEEVGVKESRVTILPGGERMRARLVLDGQRSATVFWKLFSSAGIPLDYEWEYRSDKSQAVTAGKLSGPTLSLARQTSHTLKIQDGKVRNVGRAPAIIEYIGLNKTQFEALPRAVQIGPGQAVAITDLGVSATGPNLWIPEPAVVTAFDPLDLQRAFYVLNGQQFIEHVTLTNLLPAHDAASGGALQYAELFVALGSQRPDDASGTRAGPYRLSAAHTAGSEIRLPFLRPGKGAQTLTVWGGAYYENGGCQTIATTTFDSWIVKVTPSMLAKNRPAAADVREAPCRK